MENSKIEHSQLKQLISRIERLEVEKKDITDSIRDIYAEAKSGGFDTKPLRQLIKLRKLSAQEREQQEYILDSYMVAIGMVE